MIKINLNRSRVDSDAAGATATSTALPDDALNSRDVAVKFLVMIIGVAGLALYEKQNLDELTSRLVSINAQLNKVKADVAEKQAELAKLKDIEPQAQALHDKLKILRDYSKLRLEQAQSLDFVQSIIPERVWLRSVNYQNRHYQILGNAIDTTDLTDFVGKLETSAYFQDVIVIEDKDKPAAHGSKIRDFEISARPGGKN